MYSIIELLKVVFIRVFWRRFPCITFDKYKWIDDRTYEKVNLIGKNFSASYIIDAHPKLADKWGGAMFQCRCNADGEQEAYPFCVQNAIKYRHSNRKLARAFLEMAKPMRPGTVARAIAQIFGEPKI